MCHSRRPRHIVLWSDYFVGFVKDCNWLQHYENIVDIAAEPSVTKTPSRSGLHLQRDRKISLPAGSR